MKEIVNPLLDSIEKYDATIISQLTRRISEEVVRRLKELSDHANEEEEAVRPSTAASIRSLGDGRYKYDSIFYPKTSDVPIKSSWKRETHKMQ